MRTNDKERDQLRPWKFFCQGLAPQTNAKEKERENEKQSRDYLGVVTVYNGVC
jgi:hypothetical protein